MLSAITGLKALIFPESKGCPLCGRRGAPHQICPFCLQVWADLAEGLVPCTKCGRFYSGQEGEMICWECREDEPQYMISRGVAPFEGPVREAVHYFKFCGRRELAYPFGELMAALLVQLFPFRSFSAVVPVPLHINRLRERGYNQAALLAGVIARILKIPLQEEALLRVRETPSQTSLSRQEREANMKNAFIPGKEALLLKGKRVLLVDDVYTTGATVKECCQVLASAGVGEVYVIALAAGVVKDKNPKEV
ncbi:MAG: ComF family protein [Thermacetogeniaceae bacterium]|nr:ComF family protein [Thermoanaerobacterales bacterium]NLN21675.1 ComF family protein [Syntrophomonadaceae bacterium]HAF17330.1 ComF family protein [Peptococcaceae bacterium]